MKISMVNQAARRTQPNHDRANCCGHYDGISLCCHGVMWCLPPLVLKGCFRVLSLVLFLYVFLPSHETDTKRAKAKGMLGVNRCATLHKQPNFSPSLLAATCRPFPPDPKSVQAASTRKSGCSPQMALTRIFLSSFRVEAFTWALTVPNKIDAGGHRSCRMSSNSGIQP